MKKLKILSIAVCCLVATLWSEAQCMENADLVPNEVVNGTNGRVVTGLYYRVQSKFGRYLDMRQENGEKSCDAFSITENTLKNNPWANDSFQVRLIDQGNGYYRVQSKFGRYLDMRQENGEKSCDAFSITENTLKNNPWANDSFQVRLIDQGNGYYRVQSKFGRYLDMRQENGEKSYDVFSITENTLKNNPWANDSFQVKFIPQNYKITALITDFQYDYPPESILSKHKKPLDIIEKRTIPNNSSAELTDIVSYSKTFTNTFSYGFKESLNFTAKTEVKAGIPFTASTKSEFSLSVGFEANQQITKNDSVTYSITKQVKVPAFTSVIISAYTNWIENLEMPFKANVQLKALADRLTRSGNIAHDKSVNGNVVREFLISNNFKGHIHKVEGDSVFATINGTFVGSYGLDSVFSADKTST